MFVVQIMPVQAQQAIRIANYIYRVLCRNATDGYNVSPLLCRHLFLHAELHVVVSRIEGVTYVEIAALLHDLQHITAPLENQEI